MHARDPVKGGESGAVTELLLAWSRGNDAALDEIIPLVYAELRRLASGYLRQERSGHTLETSALVHETYLRLVDQRRMDWRNRAQFFGIAAQLMRRLLVDHARRRRASVRGGLRVTFSEDLTKTAGRSVAMLDLEEALRRLEALDPRAARLVELRYFGGLTIAEAAEAMDLSAATVKREWSVARAWLRRELAGGPREGVR